MNSESLSRLRKPLRILVSLSVLLAGLCLMWACLHIYHSGGPQPFSRESVAAAFRPVAIPLFLCLAVILLSLPAQFLFPKEHQGSVRQLRMTLHRAQAEADLSSCAEELREEILLLRSNRRLYDRTGQVILVFSTILFLTYGLNGRNFQPVQIDSSIIRAMFWLLPCTAVPFAYGVFAARKNRASMEQELDLLKYAAKVSSPLPSGSHRHRRRIAFVRTGLLIIALVFLLWGLLAGGTADVLTKAVNICSECIGLG